MNRKGEVPTWVIFSFIIGVVLLAIAILLVISNLKAPNETKAKTDCLTRFNLYCTQRYSLNINPGEWNYIEDDPSHNCIKPTDVCSGCKKIIKGLESC